MGIDASPFVTFSKGEGLDWPALRSMELKRSPSEIITNQGTGFGSGGACEGKPDQTTSDPAPKASSRDQLGFLDAEQSGSSLQLLGC
jgi:hypothetical protein